jgi:hypothetical protein
MKRLVWIIIFLILQGGIVLAGFGSKNEKISLGNLLPQEINGWKVKGKGTVYNPKTIFDYINGAGEVYRSYNFKELWSMRFAKEGKPDIIADIFDMATSKDAFGVFTHDLEGEETGIGQGSTYKGGLLSFWKDRFFVSLYAEEETGETKEILFALGRKVAFSIEKEGKTPDIISFFPPKKLLEKRIRYFHNHLILNYHFFIADDNILLLDQQSEAALGTYKEKDEKLHILIVRYPEIKKAYQAYKTFTKIYMPEAIESGLVQTEDLKWTAVKVKKNLFIIVFNAPSDAFAKEMIENVEARIK